MTIQEKNPRVSAVQTVVNHIQDKINRGIWLPGEKIDSETQISGELGVSRVTVRNAVRQFIALGILESFQGKGTFVKDIDAPAFPSCIFSHQDKIDIIHIMQVRVTIESDIAYYAARNATPADIAYLQENMALLTQSSVEANAAINWEYDKAFHLKIAEISGNPYYYALLSQVLEQTHMQLVGIVSKIGSRYALHYHPAIIDAIIQHDADRAREQMREHMMSMIAQLESEK